MIKTYYILYVRKLNQFFRKVADYICMALAPEEMHTRVQIGINLFCYIVLKMRIKIFAEYRIPLCKLDSI